MIEGFVSKRRTAKRSLTMTERRYLALLTEEPDGVPLERFLVEQGPKSSGTNLVAQHIRNLRRKVAGRYEIETVRGYGYQLFPIDAEV